MKTVSVKTNTDANGGVLIDGTKTVTATAPLPVCTPPLILQNGICVQNDGPTNGLTSRYSFDTTIVDSVRGSSGQIQLNTGTPDYTIRGNSGALLIPQGTHLTGGSVLSDLMKSTQNYSFTVSTWVKFNNPNAVHAIVYERQQGGNDLCGQGATNYGLSAYNGKWLFQVTTLTDAGACKNIASIFADTGPVAGTWYHLATTFDHLTGTASIYVNGSLIKSVTGLGNRVQTALNPVLAIGNQPTAFQFMNGAMDDLRFYSRALSAQEILTMQCPLKTQAQHP
jgi:Concanavalin A-like lectin/glucanases superfamily